MKERRFYVPENFQETLKKMEAILKREGSSLSKWIRQQIGEYVRVHEPGNPQQTMRRYAEVGKPYVAMGKCVYCPRPAVTTGVYRDGREYRLCGVHRSRYARSKDWKITCKEVGK